MGIAKCHQLFHQVRKFLWALGFNSGSDEDPSEMSSANVVNASVAILLRFFEIPDVVGTKEDAVYNGLSSCVCIWDGDCEGCIGVCCDCSAEVCSAC